MRITLSHQARPSAIIPGVSGLLALLLMGCYPLARTRLAVHVLAKVEYSSGAPAVGVPLWYIDHAFKTTARNAVLRNAPICRTNSAGGCGVTVAYHYCRTAFPWLKQEQASYVNRFELVTLKNGKGKSLGFLQGVKNRGSYLEGTLWVRVD